MRRDHAAFDSDSNRATHRSQSASQSSSDGSTGPLRASASSAQRASSKGLTTGSNSVCASLVRTYQFICASARWCTTCRTVHPPGRYGVSSRSSDKPATAARSRAGDSASCCRSWRLASSSTGAPASNGPIGYRRSVKCAGLLRRANRAFSGLRTCRWRRRAAPPPGRP